MGSALAWLPKAVARSCLAVARAGASVYPLKHRVYLAGVWAMPTFCATAKLSQPDQYRRVFDSPKYKVSSGAFLLLATHSAMPSSRLGVVVAKKNIRRAVRRNRIKRLVREQFRHHPFDTAIDLVVLARSGADQLDNPSVWQELDRLWRTLEKKVNA